MDINLEHFFPGIKKFFVYILYYCGITGLVLRIYLKIRPARIIIMYHRINDNNNGLFSGVNLINFDKQVSELKKYFKFVTLSELIGSEEETKKSLVTITFDDGYKSTFTKALPVLRKNDVFATVFLTTDAISNNDLIWTDKLSLLKTINDSKTFKIGNRIYMPKQIRKENSIREIRNYFKDLPNTIKDAELNDLLSKMGVDCNSIPMEEKMLSWEEISLMNNEGMEFGAHTVNHPILTKISKEEAEREIVESKHKIESVIAKAATTFCYPNGEEGDFNETIKQILKDNGFRCAVTTIEGKVKNNDDCFALKRISLANRHPSLAVLKIIKTLIRNA